jgi:hypothetical protein
MAQVIAALASGDDALVVRKGDRLFTRTAGVAADEEIPTPAGPDKWLEVARVKHGLLRVVSAQGGEAPEVGDGFPALEPKEVGGEIVYVLRE